MSLSKKCNIWVEVKGVEKQEKNVLAERLAKVFKKTPIENTFKDYLGGGIANLKFENVDTSVPTCKPLALDATNEIWDAINRPAQITITTRERWGLSSPVKHFFDARDFEKFKSEK